MTLKLPEKPKGLVLLPEQAELSDAAASGCDHHHHHHHHHHNGGCAVRASSALFFCLSRNVEASGLFGFPRFQVKPAHNSGIAHSGPGVWGLGCASSRPAQRNRYLVLARSAIMGPMLMPLLAKHPIHRSRSSSLPARCRQPRSLTRCP